MSIEDSRIKVGGKNDEHRDQGLGPLAWKNNEDVDFIFSYFFKYPIPHNS